MVDVKKLQKLVDTSKYPNYRTELSDNEPTHVVVVKCADFSVSYGVQGEKSAQIEASCERDFTAVFGGIVIVCKL
jgi:hypothetical protein